MPGKEHMCLDVPPTIRQHIGNPAIPLFVTEGVKKGDALASVNACVVALLGVNCWRGRNEYDGKVALAGWNDIALNNRELLFVFDSDVMRKLAVYLALRNVREYLEYRGGVGWLVYLPNGENGVKMGVDDFLAAGHTLDDVMRLATKELKPPPEDESRELEADYQQTARGLVWRKPTGNGPVGTLITNFTARIVAEVVEDDGAEQTRTYHIEAQRGERRKSITVPIASFGAMAWPAEHLGAGAYVSPGMMLKEHASVAIRVLSGDPPEQRVFTHTGWRELDGGSWVYLHAGGTIGEAASSDTLVRLSGTLKNYALPEPPAGRSVARGDTCLPVPV